LAAFIKEPGGHDLHEVALLHSKQLLLQSSHVVKDSAYYPLGQFVSHFFSLRSTIGGLHDAHILLELPSWQFLQFFEHSSHLLDIRLI
jgi:hypothetical protein